MLYYHKPAQKVAHYLSAEGAPKFDSRFVAMGYEVGHDKFMKALNEHLDELNEYGTIEVDQDHAMINVAQAIGLQGYTEGFKSFEGQLFSKYLIHRTLDAYYWKMPPGEDCLRSLASIHNDVTLYDEILWDGHAIHMQEAEVA